MKAVNSSQPRRYIARRTHHHGSGKQSSVNLIAHCGRYLEATSHLPCRYDWTTPLPGQRGLSQLRARGVYTPRIRCTTCTQDYSTLMIFGIDAPWIQNICAWGFIQHNSLQALYSAVTKTPRSRIYCRLNCGGTRSNKVCIFS